MASCSEPLRKKQKTERDEDIFTTFHDVYLSKHPFFTDALLKFKQEITALAAYEIGSCNAADPDNGYSFTKAVCTLRSTKHTFAFANFFVDAFNMLKKFHRQKRDSFRHSNEANAGAPHQILDERWYGLGYMSHMFFSMTINSCITSTPCYFVLQILKISELVQVQDWF